MGYQRQYGLPQGLVHDAVLGGGLSSKIGETWQLVNYADEGIWRENAVGRHMSGLQLRQLAAARFGRAVEQVRLHLGDEPISDTQTVEQMDLFNRQRELRVHLHVVGQVQG